MFSSQKIKSYSDAPKRLPKTFWINFHYSCADYVGFYSGCDYMGQQLPVFIVFGHQLFQKLKWYEIGPIMYMKLPSTIPHVQPHLEIQHPYVK